MADVRIKDLAAFSGTPTATDFLAIDGPNETKKIPGNAYALDNKTKLNVTQLGSGDDLDTLYGNDKSGFYYITNNVANAPTTYASMIVIARGTPTYQLVWNATGIMYRAYVGNPLAWTEWKSVGVTTTYRYNQFTYNEGFTFYATSGADAPSVYKNGNIVTLSGAYKCTEAQTETGSVIIGKVPDGCKPIDNFRVLQSASGMNSYYLTIANNGNILAGKFGTSAENPIPANAWLPINCTYICQ